MSTEESTKELAPVVIAFALGTLIPSMSVLISASSSIAERTIFDKSYPLDSKSSKDPLERKEKAKCHKYKELAK